MIDGIPVTGPNLFLTKDIIGSKPSILVGFSLTKTIYFGVASIRETPIYSL